MIHRRKFLKRAICLSVAPTIWIPRANAQIDFPFFKRTAGGGGVIPAPFITGQVLGTLRNNFGLGVGFGFTMNKNVTIYSVGRWIVSGNSGSHVIKVILRAGSVLQGSATLNTSGQTPGAYAYVALGSPISITSGTQYCIESTETSSGDQWYDSNTTVTPTADGTVDAPTNSGGVGGANANHAYVPTNFLYA